MALEFRYITLLRRESSHEPGKTQETNGPVEKTAKNVQYKKFKVETYEILMFTEFGNTCYIARRSLASTSLMSCFRGR